VCRRDGSRSRPEPTLRLFTMRCATIESAYRSTRPVKKTKKLSNVRASKRIANNLITDPLRKGRRIKLSGSCLGSDASATRERWGEPKLGQPEWASQTAENESQDLV
jgi:hypothetical protein